MTSCLLLWNPRLYPTQRLVDEIEENRVGGSGAVRWNVATKKLSPGDRAFLMRVESQQGIIGVGTIATTPVRLPSWDPAKAAAGKTQLFVNVLFEQLTELPLLPWAELKQSPFADYRWTPQVSGLSIPPAIAAALEQRWAHVASRHRTWLINTIKHGPSSPAA